MLDVYSKKRRKLKKMPAQSSGNDTASLGCSRIWVSKQNDKRQKGRSPISRPGYLVRLIKGAISPDKDRQFVGSPTRLDSMGVQVLQGLRRRKMRLGRLRS